MTEEQYQSLAAQLRQPHGEFGLQVGNNMNVGNVHINKNTIGLLELSVNDEVLEIGMGNGFFVKDLFVVEPSVRYTGLDFSPLMIEEASRNNAELIQEGKVNFRLGAADAIPFDDSTFTKIFTINTLYFWDNPERILAELRRVLKKEGELFISIRPKEVMQHYPFVKYGFAMYTKEEVGALLEKNGFQVIAAIETDEPEQQIGEIKIQVKSLIIQACRG
ncbi:MAG TPA: class I SAM-dependent methyltransferase [Bacteroidetes bacterium]|nr:class I SAM-dependent methyltransferase [Bacteroidota bacterium]